MFSSKIIIWSILDNWHIQCLPISHCSLLIPPCRPPVLWDLMGTGLLSAYEAGMKRRLLQTHVRLLTDTCKTLKNTTFTNTRKIFYKLQSAQCLWGRNEAEASSNTLTNTCSNFYKYRPAYEAGMKRKLSSSSPPTLSSPASAFLTPVSPALPQKRQKQPRKWSWMWKPRIFLS